MTRNKESPDRTEREKFVVIEHGERVPEDRLEEWIEANAVPGDQVRILGENPAEVEREFEYE